MWGRIPVGSTKFLTTISDQTSSSSSHNIRFFQTVSKFSVSNVSLLGFRLVSGWFQVGFRLVSVSVSWNRPTFSQTVRLTDAEQPPIGSCPCNLPSSESLASQQTATSIRRHRFLWPNSIPLVNHTWIFFNFHHVWNSGKHRKTRNRTKTKWLFCLFDPNCISPYLCHCVCNRRWILFTSSEDFFIFFRTFHLALPQRPPRRAPRSWRCRAMPSAAPCLGGWWEDQPWNLGWTHHFVPKKEL